MGMLTEAILPLAAAADASPVALPTYFGVVIALAVGCQWLAWALKIPSLLLLLVAGFALGQWWRADDILGIDLLFGGATIAVGIILFEGSLSLRMRELRGISGPVIRLCSTVVLLAWILLTGAAYITARGGDDPGGADGSAG